MTSISTRPLRIGILGASTAAPMAMIAPANIRDDLIVTAIAARDGERAKKFARKHQIPDFHKGYQALIDRDDIDVVYNSLVPKAHAEWTIKALHAGKHVLCEKPFAMSVDEARQMVDASKQTEKILMEAFHYRYYPLVDRFIEVIKDLGPIKTLDTKVTIPLPPGVGASKRSADLTGGALMEMGCYGVHAMRAVFAEEPLITAGSVKRFKAGGDMETNAEFQFSNGGRATLQTSFGFRRPQNHVRVICAGGTAVLKNFTFPLPSLQSLKWTKDGQSRVEKGPKRKSYDYMLDALVASVETGKPPITSGKDAIANIAAIKAIYAKAGF